jgi:hypothetical protein
LSDATIENTSSADLPQKSHQCFKTVFLVSTFFFTFVS